MVVKMIVAALYRPRIIPPSRQAYGVFLIMNLMVLIHVVIVPTSAVVRSGGGYDEEIVNKVVCQGETLKIRCLNSSYAISIHGGSYGRTQPGDIVCPYAGSKNDFYFNCGENDITDKLKQICRRKKKCIFKVGKEVFGDPCRGHAYLTIIYSCVKKKKRKNKAEKPSPTVNNFSPSNGIYVSTREKLLNTSNPTKEKPFPTGNATNGSTISTTNQTGLLNGTTLSTEYGWNSSVNSTLIKNSVPNVLSTKTNGDSPGILISIIVWFIYVKSNSHSFLKVFLITLGSATFCFLFIFGLLILCKRVKEKRRKKKKLDNSEAQLPNLNTMTSSNCDVKKKSERDTLSNTFPAPPPALPPPPDDMIYPSPSPDMINSPRPLPPPANRGCSLDDISKISQDTRKHVPVTRSISLRTRPPDYQPKDLNFDIKLPNIDNAAADIQAVIIQRNNGSTMYMNPMYENGHMKEVTC